MPSTVIAGALALLLQLLLVHGHPECPSKCTCDEWLTLRRANCTSIHTHSVFTGESDGIQALDLFNNSISALQNEELSRVGLTQLRYLNLSFNAISEIAERAFANLRELAILDLSSNNLEYIFPDTFANNSELRILKLNFNKFNMVVPQLRSTSITDLGMQDCRINALLPETFKELPSLKKLDISYNKIRYLNAQIFLFTPNISMIYLQENPWNCNFSMQMFNKYLESRNILSQPVCRNTLQWSKLDKMVLKKLESKVSTKLPEGFYKIPYEKERKPNFRDPSSNLKILEHAELSSIELLKNLLGDNSTEEQKEITVTKLKDMSPYWLVAIGFLLGSAVTIVVTYVLLSTTISCFHPLNRRCLCDGTVDGVSQRVSLLHNFWQANGIDPTDSSQRPACPGTPPPPYREVMLHRNLYPNPSAARSNNADSSQATCT